MTEVAGSLKQAVLRLARHVIKARPFTSSTSSLSLSGSECAEGDDSLHVLLCRTSPKEICEAVILEQRELCFLASMYCTQ